MTWNDFHSNKTFLGTANRLQAYYLAKKVSGGDINDTLSIFIFCFFVSIFLLLLSHRHFVFPNLPLAQNAV